MVRKMTCLAVLLMLAASAAFGQWVVRRDSLQYGGNFTARQFIDCWPDAFATAKAIDDVRQDLGPYTVKVGDVFVYVAGFGHNTQYTLLVRVKSVTNGRVNEFSWYGTITVYSR